MSDSNTYTGDGSYLDDSKETAALDWYGDGPRRRVGYDDLTAIDWIFEYTKERQRLRMLYSRASGFLGQFNQLLDASQIWFVLIGTGLTAGILAGGIDVASDWLADLKNGYCRTGAGGGRFYLSKGFCCWGHTGLLVRLVFAMKMLTRSEGWAQCLDWTPWSTAWNVTGAAAGYIIEYISFILLSVMLYMLTQFRLTNQFPGLICSLC